MKKIFQSIITLLGLTLMLAACGGGNEQVSGIFAEAQYNTVACQAKSKTITLRNDDASQPQRVQALSFELGTNDQNNFKLDKAIIGSTEFTATANKIEDLIIPAGGVMTVQVTYNPRKTTLPGIPDLSYLDVFLNGPRLGIMQVKVVGEADSAAPGCGQVQGNAKAFSVTKLTVTIIHTDQPGGQIVTNSDVSGDFTFSDDSGTATITKENFPTITIHIPASVTAPIHDIPALLDDSSATGTFASNDLEFDPFPVVAAGAIHVTGKLTTKSISLTNTKATYNKSGSPLSPDGKMTLVYAAKLDDALLGSLQGGIVAFEMELQAK